MEKYFFHTAVIGAGVVGLAVARAVAEINNSVVVIEAEKCFGTGTSSRNSEVIHAGIYYPIGSKKADLCIRGKKMIYRYCLSKDISHKSIGKYIVATSTNQADKLNQIFENAIENGMDHLYAIDQKNVEELQHLTKLEMVLHSPSTGILDTHSLMQSLESDVLKSGGIVTYGSKVTDIALFESGHFEVIVNDNFIISCKNLINSSGLEALNLRNLMPVNWEKKYTNAYFKGNYFGYRESVPFSSLIYPVPETEGLGVHLTLDLTGRARFGPNVEAINSIDYSVNQSLAPDFFATIKSYWPAIKQEKLFPDYAGIRPKIKYGEKVSTDFIFETEEVHNLPGLVNLLNIESPGVTSCLAIAKDVAKFINK